MKILLAFAFYILPFALQAQPQPVKIRPLRDYYFIGQGMQLKTGINCFAITDREAFDKFFGKTNRPDTPAFANEIMLVMLMRESKQDSKLMFDRVDMKAGNFIEVYCSANMNKGRLTYTMYPIVACTIPKYKGITTLNFYSSKNMKLIQRVALKEER
jgi:hypothetical protein